MPAQDDVPSLLSDFSPVPEEQWRARVEQGGQSIDQLDSSSLDGPPVRALYTAGSIPGLRPPSRAPGWRIALEYRHGEAKPATLKQDVARGLESAWLQWSADTRSGAIDGPEAEALPSQLKAIGADVSVHIDAGVGAPAAVRALIEHRPEGSPDAVLFDPLTTLSTLGGLGVSLGEAYAALAEATQDAAERRPGLRTILVDTVMVHDAGATAQQEVAFAIAVGLEHLRQLERHGLTPAQSMPHMALRMSVGGDLLMEVAKLRAVQRLWARIRAHSRAGSGAATPLWARTSWRASTRRDPWVNLLRGSVGGLSAVLGGASVIAVQPFTEAMGKPSADARRWAINTQHILRGESHLGKVDDPVAGSWAFEGLTDSLARGAWDIARGWLGQGGLAQALRNGLVQAEVAESAAARTAQLATGKASSTGVTLYPDLNEPTLDVPPVPEEDMEDDWRVWAPTLDPSRPVAPFEALRDRSDAFTEANGERPTAALITVGEPAKARAQLDFARNLVTVGGWQSVVLEAGADVPKGVSLAVLCAPTEPLAEHGPAELRRLSAAGVSRTLVAGLATEALKKAGAHDFVHRGRDVLALLTALQADLFTSNSKADA